MKKKALRSLQLRMQLGFLAFVSGVEAQQPGKIPRIGLPNFSSPSAGSSPIEAFRQGLRELGYMEGKNIVIEWRYAEGNLIVSPRSRLSSCVSR